MGKKSIRLDPIHSASVQGINPNKSEPFQNLFRTIWNHSEPIWKTFYISFYEIGQKSIPLDRIHSASVQGINPNKSEPFQNLFPNHLESFWTNLKNVLYLVLWNRSKINPPWSDSFHLNPNKFFNPNESKPFQNLFPNQLESFRTNPINVFYLVLWNRSKINPPWFDSFYFNPNKVFNPNESKPFQNLFPNHLESFRTNPKNFSISFDEIGPKSIPLDPIHSASVQGINPNESEPFKNLFPN